MGLYAKAFYLFICCFVKTYSTIDVIQLSEPVDHVYMYISKAHGSSMSPFILDSAHGIHVQVTPRET